MALLDFGGDPVKVDATGGAPFENVLDLGLYFGSMTLLLTLVNFVGASANFKLRIETAMTPKSDNWVSLGTFATLTTMNSVDKANFTDLLRYVRWYVYDLGAASSATFTLSGVARNP